MNIKKLAKRISYWIYKYRKKLMRCKNDCNCNCKHELERLKHKCVVLSAENEELERRLKKYED